MERENIAELKKQQIYKLLYMPLTKEEKVDRIAQILSKTDEEIIEETRVKTTLKDDLRDMFKYLREQKEGEINENKKNK